MNTELNRRFIDIKTNLDLVLDNHKRLAIRLAAVENAIETSRAQDLAQSLASVTRRLDDLQASVVQLDNQIQILNDTL